MFTSPKEPLSKKNIQEAAEMSQAGKSLEDILPYLLSGDSDDVSSEILN